MPPIFNPVVFAGVVIRQSDGTTHAFELLPERGPITADINVQREYEDYPLGSWSPIFDSFTRVDINLSGYGMRSARFAGYANDLRPQQAAITEAPREIEEGSTDDQ